MPISPAEVSAIIMSLLAGILILVIAIRVFMKWKEKRQTATIFLFLSNITWVGGCWSAMGIYALAESATLLAIILQKCVYSFVFAGGMMMFLFGTQVFFHFKSKLWPYLYIIAGILCILLVFGLDSVGLQYFVEYGGYPLLSIKIEYSIILVIYLVPVLIGIAFLAIRTSHKLEDRVYAIGYRFIAYGNLSILAIFVVDALSTEAQGFYAAYAVLLNFTWIIPIIAAFCSYIGWTLPEWFRVHFNQK